MGTLISLYIKNNDQAKVALILQKLANTNGPITEKYNDNLNGDIILDEEAYPTFLKISESHNGWVAVYLNSFKKLHDWSETISKEFNTTVIQVLAQTASAAYYFLMYENGALRREIDVYYGDFEMATDKGERFPFEAPSFTPEDEDDYEDLFDIQTIANYCNAFGFDIYEDISKDTFLILEKNTSIYQAKKTAKKIWWKFWQ